VRAGEQSGVILVVEDEWLLRDDVAGELRRAGWDVLEASTGEGALKLLKDYDDQIDIVFTDIQLAGYLSGWDVAEAFRAKFPKRLVIYASGNSFDRRRRVSNSVFFRKPYRAGEVVASCRRSAAQPAVTH